MLQWLSTRKDVKPASGVGYSAIEQLNSVKRFLNGSLFPSFTYIFSSSFIGNTLNGKDVVELLKCNHLKLTLCHPKMKIWCWK